ncbi:MAG: hypothetical protein FWD31_02945 [Planctomycetaceae bacterium]|nr:hypothetical protein [Planctomycetaceae bacterium]
MRFGGAYVLDELDVEAGNPCEDITGLEGVAGPGSSRTITWAAGSIGCWTDENSSAGELTDVPPPKNGTMDLDLSLDRHPKAKKQLKMATTAVNFIEGLTVFFSKE